MDQVAEVREKIDIVSFISEYISIKHAGKNFKALCPFHGEKTPSFVISPERQIWHCFGCFPPGEKVKTPFGYHNIEEIDENHWVVSGKGNIKKVTQVMSHQYKGKLTTIGLRKLGGKVSLTNDHTVFAIRGAPYTQRQYKNFSRQYNKYLKIKNNDENKYYQLTQKYFPIREIPAGSLQKGDLLLYPINRNVHDIEAIDLSIYLSKSTKLGPVPKKIPFKISLTDEFLKLLGYWIAQGSNHRAYIRFSLGNHEEEFAQEIVQLIKKVFGLDAKIYRRPTLAKTGLEITACHSQLANIFANLCGKGAANKHIPFVFQELPIKKQKVLLEAIFKGDGTSFVANRSHNLHKSITTISRILAEQLIDIILRLHYFPTLCTSKSHIDKLQVNHKEAYSVFWSEEIRQKYNLTYFQPDGSEYWLLPIIDIKEKFYEGPVYNFTVDKDHSYIATNFAVANCGKGGDAFTFFMEYEHVEFPEALRYLAKKAGVTLTQTGFETETSAKREHIYKLNLLASEFYHFVLTKHQVGKKALAYVQQRGVNERTVKTFGIGYAPKTGSGLSQYLIKKKGYKKGDLIDAGLALSKGSSVVDFFWDRLIFPLYDQRDNIVGFSGRVLTENAKGPKYINTRETLVYHKGNLFFGLATAKNALREKNQAIIVEGEFDVISCFQAGILNVLAVKGTALTEHQVQILARYVQKVTICFDGDRAGQEAIKRSLPLLEKKGLTTTVIIIPNGKDPDEAIKHDEYAFKKAMKEDINIYDYLLKQLIKIEDSKTSDGKKKISQELLPVYTAIQNEIVKEHYLRKLAENLDTTYESIQKEIDRTEKKQFIKAEITELRKERKSREEILEEYLVALILQSQKPKQTLEKAIGILSKSMPRERAYQKILYQLLDHFTHGEEFSSKQFGEYLPQELVSAFNTCLLFPTPLFSNQKEQMREVEKVAIELLDKYNRKRLISQSTS